MNDRVKSEIIACCKSVIRNADKIANDYVFDQTIEITIAISGTEVPTVTVKKTVVPKEVTELYNER